MAPGAALTPQVWAWRGERRAPHVEDLAQGSEKTPPDVAVASACLLLAWRAEFHSSSEGPLSVWV